MSSKEEITYRKCPKCGRQYPLASKYGDRVVVHNNTYCKPCLRVIEAEAKT